MSANLALTFFVLALINGVLVGLMADPKKPRYGRFALALAVAVTLQQIIIGGVVQHFDHSLVEGRRDLLMYAAGMGIVAALVFVMTARAVRRTP